MYSNAYAQINNYTYSRELTGVKDQWHKLTLPNSIFQKLNIDFSDIRIVGITSNNDTVEAPYILQLKTDNSAESEISFTLLNKAKNNQGYYFTFKVENKKNINKIKLDFSQQNFDWKVTLQGSENQQEWFTVLSDYRVLSLKNQHTNFSFTDLNFTTSNYAYYRLLVPTTEQPELLTAKIYLHQTLTGTYQNYALQAIKTEQLKSKNQSVTTIYLEQPVPVCKLKLHVKDTIDYYRSITIKYLADSFKTDKGYQYTYHTLATGSLNSLQPTEFNFASTTAQQFLLIVNNQNNAPLTVDSIQLLGYVHELLIRIATPANYYLMYGNTKATLPSYDITHFADKIPIEIIELKLGNEQQNTLLTVSKTAALFENKIWLWVVMAIIIILLGGFTFSMIKNK